MRIKMAYGEVKNVYWYFKCTIKINRIWIHENYVYDVYKCDVLCMLFLSFFISLIINGIYIALQLHYMHIFAYIYISAGKTLGNFTYTINMKYNKQLHYVNFQWKTYKYSFQSHFMLYSKHNRKQYETSELNYWWCLVFSHTPYSRHSSQLYILHLLFYNSCFTLFLFH